MMQPLGFLLFGVLARILWAAPLLVAYACVAAIGVAVVFDKLQSRARMKAYKVNVEAKMEEWEQCSARRAIFDGFELHCVKRAGHDGDDAAHLASRDDLYWPGNE